MSEQAQNIEVLRTSESKRLSQEELGVSLESLLDKVAEVARPCKACGVKLWFVRHRNGRLTPYTFEGVNHFKNCTSPSDFKRGNG